MLVLPLLLATLVGASPQQVLKAPKSEYNILNPSLVHEIDQLRREWDINGAGIAVVRMKDDGKWEQDMFGLGIADGRGNAVTEHVS